MCNNVQYYDNRFDYLTGNLCPLPCGFCAGCRIDKRVLWERRLTSEYVVQRCAFVCFTYDDYHLTWKRGALRPSVNKIEFHKFMDNLRHKVHTITDWPEYCTPDYKVYAVAEYGEKNLRPHYHALFFGLDWLYFKKLFQDYWQFGNVDVGPILKGGLRYPLKYIDKQQFPAYRDMLYTDVGIEPTFTYISPAIGAEYFVSQSENIAQYGCLKIGSRFVPVPSYWRNKLFSYCDQNVYKVREVKQKHVNEVTAFALSHGYESYDDFLRQSRYALECNLEKQARKRHEAILPVSSQLPRARLKAGQELILYRTKHFIA